MVHDEVEDMTVNWSKLRIKLLDEVNAIYGECFPALRNPFGNFLNAPFLCSILLQLSDYDLYNI